MTSRFLIVVASLFALYLAMCLVVSFPNQFNDPVYPHTLPMLPRVP